MLVTAVEQSDSDTHTHTQSSHVALVVKNPPADAGDIRHLGSTPGLGRSPGGGPHSSILAWRIPQTEEPGRLWSTGSQRVVHN